MNRNKEDQSQTEEPEAILPAFTEVMKAGWTPDYQDCLPRPFHPEFEVTRGSH